MSRVEVLSDSDEEVDEDMPSLEAIVAKAKSKPVNASSGPIGPPRPPAGIKLKRVGKSKKTPMAAEANNAASNPTFAAPVATASSNAPPAAASASEEDDDDSDDLPPPLEPMPFVAKKKKQTASSSSSAAPAVSAVVKPASYPKPSVIGPAKPASVGKKGASSPQESKSETAVLSSELPAYLERDLQDFPLFSTGKLSDAAADNDDFAALQAMVDEETPENRAENFKDSGNECLQHGKTARWWDEAIEYYTRAIQCGSRDFPKVSIYFSNRAAVQILKKNWGHAIKDCVESLELDPNNVKAMYRAAKSHYELRRLPEALTFLRKAMAKAKTTQLVELERDIARQMRKERLKDEKRAKETEEVLENRLKREETLRERGYRFSDEDVYAVEDRMRIYNCGIVVESFDEKRPNELDVNMPVMVVYPQSRQSDFVQQWSEQLFIRDMLEMLFRESEGTREWDVWQLYNLKNLSNMLVYVKTNDTFDTYEKQEWQQIKLSQTLSEALTCNRNYIIPVVPVFFVFHVSFKETFFGKETQELWGTPAHRIN